MPKVRDQQRSKVYKWERQCVPRFAAPLMTLDEIRAVVTRVARHYKIDPVNVTDGRGRRSACYQHWGYQIKMPRWSRSMAITLHECAHWIHRTVFDGGDEPAHGREFMAVFIYLLGKYHNCRTSELARSANLHKVDFASVDACRPKNT